MKKGKKDDEPKWAGESIVSMRKVDKRSAYVLALPSRECERKCMVLVDGVKSRITIVLMGIQESQQE